jgi:hypothetical protein
MAISSLDTLDISKRLKGAGFNDAQAETVTEIFRDVREADLANLATKTDIDRLGAATKSDFERLEAATKSDFERLEATTKSDFERLEDKLEILRRDMTIRLGGMIIAATAVLLAAKFFG